MNYTVELTKNISEKLEELYSQPFDRVETEVAFNMLLKILSINPFVYPVVNGFRVVVGTILSYKLVYFIEDDKVVIFDTIDWTDFA